MEKEFFDESVYEDPINIYTCMEYTQISDIYVRLIPGHLFSKRERIKKKALWMVKSKPFFGNSSGPP